MSSRPSDHKDLIREEFTRQASAYAASRSISDPERVARLVGMVAPPTEARVLEVATGPGYVAFGFALVCREVVGIDLTAAPLAIAEKGRQERGLENVSFQIGDAEQLPFDDGTFDVVVCRLAFHHLEKPSLALREMVRVCRPSGKVAVEDLIVSEHPERAAYHNYWENLRDPSHTRALPLTEHVHNFAAAGLEVEDVRVDLTHQDAERWLARSYTPPERAAAVRALLERDAHEDLSGTAPYWDDGRLFFHHRAATIVGRRLKIAPKEEGR
jgi:ubiquinone/menaquinone biosynthesis C-methylase UbiE